MNLAFDSEKLIAPVAKYDGLTAGNPNLVRANDFDGLRSVLAAFSGAESTGGGSDHDLGANPSASFNVAILLDLVLMGDGGLFTERIITPMFQALAFELSTKGGNGCEPALRITYDDANESFVLPKNVQAILSDLACWCAPCRDAMNHL